MNYRSGIFLISAATLLFEISLTRVFSVLFFHHFAFLMVSTALFGFGFSGIFLFLRKGEVSEISNRLSLWAILFGVSVLLTYKIILILPYGFKEIPEQPAQVFRLVMNYAVLAVPFFFSGAVIGLILSSFPDRSGLYYCFDLAGAALGCLSVLWLVPTLGASGAIVFSSLLGALAALTFWPQKKSLRWIAITLSAVVVGLSTNAEQIFSLPLARIFQEKHGTFYQVLERKLEYSAWSPVSRIDVISTSPKVIYLDGGSNVSFLIPFPGNFRRLQPRINWRTIPYMLAHRENVCIIGPGGGEDVLNALSHQSESIIAVEMDPLIVNIVQGKYSRFIGNIFEHPSVRLVNDEGRSFLRRSEQQFDLIQTVHNCSPMALASGALNLSESYLLTVESFQEFWKHLKPGGMFVINRSGILRAASIASVILQQEGIADPQNYVIVTSKLKGGDTGFYLKKGKIADDEIKTIAASGRDAGVKLEYAPTSEFQKKENPYYRLLVPDLREDFIRTADIVLAPSTDNWPFFQHYQKFGSFRTTTSVLPEELNAGLVFHNAGDLALFTLLGEALVLSFLFILFPLIRLKKIRNLRSNWRIALYFSAIGMGFILIEISLIQKHILFLGQPVYSITCVLFSILLSAGAGSLLFQSRFKDGRERVWLGVLSAGLAIFLCAQVFLVPKLFDLYLGEGRWVRFIISGLSIAPLGLLLGIPFPLGIRILGQKFPEAIPWGWGLNAYMTVLGSILCIIVAVTWGFRANFAIAFFLYFSAFFAFYSTFGKENTS